MPKANKTMFPFVMLGSPTHNTHQQEKLHLTVELTLTHSHENFNA